MGSLDPSNNSSWSVCAVAAAPSQLLVLCLLWGFHMPSQQTPKPLHSSRTIMQERVSEAVGKCGFFGPKQQQFIEGVCGCCCPISAACSVLLTWFSSFQSTPKLQHRSTMMLGRGSKAEENAWFIEAMKVLVVPSTLLFCSVMLAWLHVAHSLFL